MKETLYVLIDLQRTSFDYLKSPSVPYPPETGPLVSVFTTVVVQLETLSNRLTLPFGL